jgi:hypothetical protein
MTKLQDPPTCQAIHRERIVLGVCHEEGIFHLKKGVDTMNTSPKGFLLNSNVQPLMLGKVPSSRINQCQSQAMSILNLEKFGQAKEVLGIN